HSELEERDADHRKPRERRHPCGRRSLRPRRDEEEEEDRGQEQRRHHVRGEAQKLERHRPRVPESEIQCISLLETMASSSVSGLTSRPWSGTPSRTRRSTAAPTSATSSRRCSPSRTAPRTSRPRGAAKRTRVSPAAALNSTIGASETIEPPSIRTARLASVSYSAS